MLLPLMVLMALPAAEPNEAEKLFRDMEKKVHSAKTLECTFTVKADGMEKIAVKGTLSLAQGNKFSVEATADKEGKTHKANAISDGTTLQSSEDDKSSKKETPKFLGQAVLASITRTGSTVFYFLDGPPDKEVKF